MYRIKYDPHLYSWQYSFNKQDISCYNVESTIFSLAKFLNIVESLCLLNLQNKGCPSLPVLQFFFDIVQNAFDQRTTADEISKAWQPISRL